MSSPIQYTSRTFQTILADINTVAGLVDKPDWWKDIWSGVGDVLSTYLNAQANNTFLRTAFTRQAVADLAALIDYALSPRTTATGEVLFDLISSVSFPVSIPAVDVVALTVGSLAVSAKRYESRAAASIAAQVTGTFTTTHAAETLTVTRDFTNTEKVRLTTTGTLPAGFALLTDYWVIRVDSTTLQLATSRANALAGTAVTISDDGAGTHTWNLLSFTADLFQQDTVSDYTAGEADATEEWKEIDLADIAVLKDTLVVTINSVDWPVLGTGALESSFVFSESSDKHVQLVFLTDESSKLRFGDGTYGEIPGAFDVVVGYAIGGGADSNASVGTIVVYAGTDSDIESVYNVAALTGGASAESLQNAKDIAPLLLKARSRFVTTEDGEALVLDFGGLTQTVVNKNVYGVLSAQVLAIAAGGGNPSSAVKTALQTDLINRSILESIDVRVEDATFLVQNVTSSAKMLSGFTYANVEPFFDLAWRLFFTEAGKEIQDDLTANGIASTVTLINSIFSTSFGASDYAQVTSLVENLTPREFGVDVQESDAFGYIDNFVEGVDYILVAAPSFPISVEDDEITQIGSRTLTEIP